MVRFTIDIAEDADGLDIITVGGVIPKGSLPTKRESAFANALSLLMNDTLDKAGHAAGSGVKVQTIPPTILQSARQEFKEPGQE